MYERLASAAVWISILTASMWCILELLANDDEVPWSVHTLLLCLWDFFPVVVHKRSLRGLCVCCGWWMPLPGGLPVWYLVVNATTMAQSKAWKSWFFLFWGERVFLRLDFGGSTCTFSRQFCLAFCFNFLNISLRNIPASSSTFDHGNEAVLCLYNCLFVTLFQLRVVKASDILISVKFSAKHDTKSV